MLVLYELLQVKQDATAQEIRKAYLVLAKKLHPDKQADKKDGHAFLQLKKAYDILSNEQARKRYDLTGDVESAEESASFQEAYERFRGVRVTEEDIVSVEREYRHSEEERADLEAFFQQHKGDVRLVLAYVIASRAEDIPRFLQIWDEALAQGRVNKRYRKAYDASKLEIVQDLDEMEEDEEDEEEDEAMGSEGDEAFIASEEEEEAEEEEAMEFSPGDLVQVKTKAGWVDAFVMSTRRGKYDLELVSNKEKMGSVDPALVRRRPEQQVANKRLKAQQMAEEEGLDPALVAMIQNRNKARNQDLVKEMQAKYTKKKKQ